MKNFKRLLSLILVMIMLLSSLSINMTVSAETIEGVHYDTIWRFDAESGILYISGNGTVYSSAPWNKYEDGIKKVVIGSDITSINERAFSGYSNLSEVEIPDTLTDIGFGAFYGTPFLNSLPIKNRQICLGDRLLHVDDFSGSITINQDIKHICDGAFSDNIHITSITIPEGIISIGDIAFEFCTIKTMVIPDSVTSIGYGALRFCPSFETVTLSKNITRIERQTFYGCTGLKNMVIPDGVTTIEYEAFLGCDNLESIYIPSSVSFIREDAFYYCPKLTITCYENSYAHKYAEDNSIDYELLYCDHSFTNYEITTPTCTEDSYKTAYCDNGCGTSDTVVIEGSALGHSFTNYEYNNDATCKENGTETAKCDRCDVTDTVEIENSSLSHSFTNYKTVTELSCTENGVKEALCDNGCGEKEIITEEAIGHILGEWIVIEEPTYDFEGFEIQNCTVCSEVVNTETIPALVYEGFPDVEKSAWYYEGVEYCFKQGYIVGTDKETFEPDASLTREQFVTILARVAGAKLSEYTDSNFNDVEADSWYGPSVIWANENGYVNGVGNGNFGVGQPLSREQLAAMFYRYAEKLGLNIDEKSELSCCKDKDQISSWALDACAWAIKAKLLSSTSQTDNYLSPKMTVTRSQAAKIFMSFDAYTNN